MWKIIEILMGYNNLANFILYVIFWLIVMGGLFSALFIIPMKVIDKMAKRRNLEEPKGWKLSCLILTWYTPLLYYIFIARKYKKL